MKLITRTESGLPSIITQSYEAMGVLPDGRICGVHRLLFHWTMHIGIDDIGYEDRYCFATRQLASAALFTWEGDGDPRGWHKHPPTRRLHNIFTDEIWHEVEWERTEANRKS